MGLPPPLWNPRYGGSQRFQRRKEIHGACKELATLITVKKITVKKLE